MFILNDIIINTGILDNLNKYINPLFNGKRISKCCKITNKMIEDNLAYDMNNYVYLDFTID